MKFYENIILEFICIKRAIHTLIYINIYLMYVITITFIKSLLYLKVSVQKKECYYNLHKKGEKDK